MIGHEVLDTTRVQTAKGGTTAAISVLGRQSATLFAGRWLYPNLFTGHGKDIAMEYDALLGSAGITPMFEHPSGGRVYGKDVVLS